MTVLFIVATIWEDAKQYVFGGGFVVFITAVIGFIKNVKGKPKSEIAKDEAEAKKIVAEAYETTERTNINIMDAALKLAQRLSEECDSIKQHLFKVQQELDREKQKNLLMQEEILALKDQLAKIKELQYKCEKTKEEQ